MPPKCVANQSPFTTAVEHGKLCGSYWGESNVSTRFSAPNYRTGKRRLVLMSGTKYDSYFPSSWVPKIRPGLERIEFSHFEESQLSSDDPEQ